jgi:hypothetical protein
MGHDAVVNVDHGAAPSGRSGFGAAFVANALVAIALWFAVTSKYGFSGYGAISYHYGEWLGPVAAFIAIAVLAGLVSFAVRGWRWFGVGVMFGAATVGLLDLAWTLAYFVSQGS